MTIGIMGTDCANCTALHEAGQATVKEKGVAAEVIVEDMPPIMRYCVMGTLALVIEGRLIEITGMLP